MSKRKHLTSEQKVIILREHLENNVPVSELAERYNIHPNDIYNWKKKLFESAADNIFSTKNSSLSSATEKKMEKLEGKLKDNQEAITYLVTENIELKKNINGDD